MSRPTDFETFFSAAVDASAVNPADSTNLKGALAGLYEMSFVEPKLAMLFDYLWGRKDTNKLTFISDSFWQGIGASAIVRINSSRPFVFDQSGTVSVEAFDRTLLHELFHLLPDSTSSTGFLEDPHLKAGLTRSQWLELTNQGLLASNGHLGDVETSVNTTYPYFSTASYYLVQGDVNTGNIFKVGASYTYGQHIDAGVWLGAIDSSYLEGPGGTINRSNAAWGNQSFLLIGGVGADSILGGSGNDYLYGLEGNDAFVGGAGSDFIDGGHHQMPRAQGQPDREVDTVDYRDFSGPRTRRQRIDFRDGAPTSPIWQQASQELLQVPGKLLIPVADDGTSTSPSATTSDLLFDVEFVRLPWSGATIMLGADTLTKMRTPDTSGQRARLAIDAILNGDERDASAMFVQGPLLAEARSNGQIKFRAVETGLILSNEMAASTLNDAANQGKLVIFHRASDDSNTSLTEEAVSGALLGLLLFLLSRGAGRLPPLPRPVPPRGVRTSFILGGTDGGDGVSIASLSQSEVLEAGSQLAGSVIQVSMGAGSDELAFADSDTPDAPVQYELWTATATRAGGESGSAAAGSYSLLFSERHGHFLLDNVENVYLTGNTDQVGVAADVEAVTTATVFDGGSAETTAAGDIIDLTQSTIGRFISGASEGPGVEIFLKFDLAANAGRQVWNVVVPSGSAGGMIFSGATGLRFANFEQVIGSNFNDVLDMRQLNAGGALSPADQSTYDSLRNTPVSFGSSPNALAAQMDSLVAQAGAIAQNQQAVLIDGGAGNDIVIGTDTGADSLFGGAGNDAVVAGGFTSVVHGGDGTDLVVGGGMKSQLYGDAGADIFMLANNSFVMDAGTDDYVMWGPMQVTGAVQQSWQEGAWAYWSPLTSLMSYAPLPFLNSFGQVFGAGMMLLDTVAMSTLRYAQTDSGQLIVQMGRGRAGQGIIENYSVDLETGAATGNVVVARLGGTPSKKSLSEMMADINVILKSGFGTCFMGTDPLVLDLDGDGIELTRADASNTYFDIDNDGFAEKTAWVKADDGLLARDLNGNGTIDGISELFGDATTPGFTALAALDSNADGKITAADAAFSTLRVWRDANGNGVTDTGELQTLAQAGITEISLSTHAPVNANIRGNTISAEGSFTRADGTTSTVGNVLLDGVQTDSRYLGDLTVSAQAASLPNLKGYGNLVDLAVAATDDAGLLSLVSAFTALPTSTTFDGFKASADDILFRWAGVQGVAATPMGGGVFDQQKLAFLEKYYGYQLTPRVAGVPFEGNLSELVASWNTVLADLTARLAVQGPLHAVLGAPAFNVASDNFVSAAVTSLADTYKAAIQQLSAVPATAATQWTTLWAPILAIYADALVRPDGIDVRTDFAVQSLVKALDGITAPLSLAQLVGGLGLANVQVGTTGADALSRSGSSLNVFVGGDGNDTLTGGFGQDVYVFGRNFGQDTINDTEGVLENGDRIRFALLNEADVTMRRVGSDLVITVNGTGDKITVLGQYDAPAVSWNGMPITPDRGVEEVQFANGGVLDAVDIAAKVGLGTNASEVIDGSGAQDVLEGLKGNDTLRGGENGDSYFYTRGDDADVILDVTSNPLLNASDTLFLLGMSRSDLRVSRSADSDDVTLSFSWGGNDSILLDDQFAYSVLGYQSKISTNSRIEQLMFDHSAGMTWVDLQQLTIDTYTTILDDATYGFGTSDLFASSGGNDTLVGFDGGDTYSFGIGSGLDIVEDNSRYPEDFNIGGLIGYQWKTSDTVQFAAGITAADVRFARDGATPDLLITISGQADTLRIKNQFVGEKLDLFGFFGIAWFDRVELFKFADGTTLTWEDVLHTVTTGSADDDTLYGAYYQDTLDGKGGADFLSGGNDSDVYLFGRGYGSDTIKDNQDNPLTPSIDTLKFGSDVAVGDVIFERDGATLDLIVRINGTSDQVRLVNQYDVLETGVFGPQAFDRIDRFEWADGTVKTWAQVSQSVIDAMRTSGNDTILGSHDADRIDGGAGDDLLKGGSGDDTYIFGRGYGQDTISDSRDDVLSGATDTLEFAADVLPGDVDVLRGADNDIALRIRNTGDTVTLLNQDDPSIVRLGTLERVTFANGTVWNEASLRQLAVASQQTTGSDIVRGFHVADTIEGGAGNDMLRGAEGDDTYRFGAGFGQDTIEEIATVSTQGGNDTIEFLAGIVPSSVTLSRPAGTDDLVLTVGSNSITIKNQFLLTPVFGMQNDVERVVFADGTVWTDEMIRSTLLTQATTTGADVIRGFSSADILDGGAGNDTLQGGTGGDIYRFGVGYGRDLIDETADLLPVVTGADTVEFAAGIVRSNVVFSRVGNDLVATLTGGSDVLTIKDHFASGYIIGSPKIEYFRFSNNWLVTAAQAEVNALGSDATGSQTINGTTGADTLDGGVGSDTLIGGNGSDTYVFGRGYGADVVDDRNANSTVMGVSTDVVAFAPGIVAEDLQLSYIGNNLVVTVAGTSDVLTVKDQYAPPAMNFRANAIEEFTFADGTTWTDADMRERLLAAQQTAGNDTVRGYFSDDTLEGSGGNDVLMGRDGSDVYRFAAGFGQDTIAESVDDLLRSESDAIQISGNVTAANISFSRPVGTDDLLITVGSTGDTIRVQGQFTPYSYQPSRTDIEEVRLADGTVWTDAQIRSLLLAQAKTTGNDLVHGFYTDDVLDGGAGNDTLQGGDGGDIYLFGRGSGQDVVQEGLEYHVFLQKPDTVRFGDGVAVADIAFTRIGVDLVASIVGTSDKITIKGHYTAGTYVYTRMESFLFADGTTISAAEAEALAIIQQSTAASDTILGSNTDDLIDPGAGADSMSGGTGADAYVFGRGYGADTIDDKGDNSASVLDTVRFRAGVAPEDVLLSRSGDNVILGIAGTGDSVTLKGQSPQFVATGFELGNRIEQIVFDNGTAWSAEELDRRVVVAAASSGNDTIVGAYGADRLDGLAGDDLLQGGIGDDTYIFGRGYGTDAIDDSNYTTSDKDIIVFKSGVRSSDIQFSSVGDDVTLRIIGTNDSLTIRNQQVGALTGASIDRIDTVTFTEEPAVAWTAADLQNRLFAGSALNDTVTGSTSNDVINGLAGNDILSGRAGNDQLLGGNGDDTLNGGAGADTLDGGAGTDTVVYDTTVVVDRVTAANSTGDAAGDTLIGIESFMLSAFNDRFVGTTAAETIDGGAGSDTMAGGSGNDTYYVDRSTDIVTEAVGGGTDSVYASASYTLAAEIENLTLTGSATTGTGNASANILMGTGGANTLDGGAGADTMIGGGGDDIYLVGVTGDNVTELVGGGYDTVRSTASYALSSEVEALIMLGLTATSGTGNALANMLDGSQSTAANTLIGGAGDDTYYVGTGDVVTEAANAGIDSVFSAGTFTLGTDVENLTLTGLATANATGNALGNVLTGNSGTNRLDGGAGADTMAGGGGNDTYVVDVTGDVVTEFNGGGTDTIEASFTITALVAYVENLTLTGTAALNGTGNDLANVVTGNSGNNRLDGGLGADTLIGGAGNDTYVVDSTADIVTEAASAGTDAIETSVTITSLALNVENLTLVGSAALNGTGNTLANVLTGNAGANRLNGGGGADTMVGGAGNDTYVIDASGDVVTELSGGGTDAVETSITIASLATNVENLTLTGALVINGTGNDLANVITGNSGNNVLNGWLGLDTLSGGAGNDTFLFNTLLGVGNVDVITDFSVPADTINLENTGAGLFTALPTVGTLTAAAFKIGPTATDADDRIVYNSTTGDLFYDPDGTGASAQIRFAIVQPGLAMTNADFVVV